MLLQIVNKQSLQRRIAAVRQIDYGEELEPGQPTVPAAVLIPLIERRHGYHILLTRRTETLRSHPGQISFPGGRIEPEDRSVEAAALRESQEEIGLAPDSVDIIGRMGSWRLATGYVVYPVVGTIDLPVQLRPDPSEVAEIFELPLSFLLDPSNHKPHIYERNGQRRELVAMPYGNYYIWGATAAMLHGLYQALVAEEAD